MERRSNAGHRYRIPNLWTYFAIAQILPISFTLNLFYIALLLTPMRTSPSQPKDSSKQPTLSAYLTALYYALYGILLVLAHPYRESANLIPLVLTIRMMLLGPALIDLEMTKYRSILLLPLAAHWITMPANGLLAPGLVSRILRGINDNPAVSALGWDYVLCGVSAGVWWFRVEE